MAVRGELHFSKRRKKINFQLIREIFEWIFEIVLVIMMAYLLVTFFASRTHVVGSSMEPTLYADDNIWVNQFCYIISNPKQGDVVTFLPNGNEKSHYYVRRIVAVPGDTVQIKGGKLYVNGEVYETDLETEEIADAGVAEEEITLKEQEYFLLGDNRNNSEDSRYANIGNVKKEDIVGKVWFRFSSLRSFGFVK